MISRKILVIDDEEVLREIVQNCLEDLGGWDVITAKSEQEALKKVMEGGINAIILDIMMPGISDLEFLQLLNDNLIEQFIPVVLLTSRLEFTNPKQMNGLNLAGGIFKPFDPYELVERIAIFLNWELKDKSKLAQNL